MELSALLLCIIMVLLNAYESEAITSNRDKNRLRDTFGINMNVDLVHYTGYSVLNGVYEKARKSKSGKNIIQVQRTNGTELISAMANDLRKLLKKKHNAVRRLVDTLESHSKTINWSSVQPADAPEFSYYNVEYMNKKPDEIDEQYEPQRKSLQLTPDDRFLNRPVNFSRSVVQVPFDVYSRRSDVLRDANWTRILDEKFKKNLENDPSLKWQYFGTTAGLLRFYPPFQWKMYSDSDRPNVYDCRMKPWYTKAATFPKDMIILVDSSGSMEGLKKWVASHIVQALVDTLGDNDFFNILTYSDVVEYVEPCFDGTLVRADGGNKGKLMESLRHIQPKSVADLSSALEAAFNLTLKFHSTNSGSGCYSSVVIITDGATYDYQDLMDRYNNLTDRQIRVFSYLVGSDTSYMESVRDIACNNDGFFQQVLSRNDIKEKVLRYLTVMNRPQAIQEDHHTAWTKPYYDQTYLDYGFGLVSTVSAPAYVRRSSGSGKTLGGVAATDVPIDHMLNVMPIHRTGVNGYAFIVTNNGYVVAHPRFETFFTKMYHSGTLSIKPNYNSIDIDALEGAAVNETIRTSILANTIGRTEYRKAIIPLDNWKRFILVRGRYHFSSVDQEKFPFHVGAFLPDSYGKQKLELSKSYKIRKSSRLSVEKNCTRVDWSLPYKYPAIEDVSREDLACGILANQTIWLPDTWRYCYPRNESVAKSGKSLSQLELIKTYLFQQQKSNISIECDLEMVNLVLADVFITSALEVYWNDYPSGEYGAVVVFSISSSGVQRRRWQSVYRAEYKQNILNVLTGFGRQSYPSFYRRTVAYKPNAASTPCLYTLINTGINRTDILVSKALRRNGYVYAVSGMVISAENFTDKFWNDANSSTCSWNPNAYLCYLIDDNGILLLSNTESWKYDAGKSIAEVDGQLTRVLLDAGYFTVVNLYDRSSVCQVARYGKGGEDHNGALSNLPNPFRSAIGYLTFWTMEFASLLGRLSIVSIWTHITSLTTTRATFKARENGFTIHYDVCDAKYKVLSVNTENLANFQRVDIGKNCTRFISIKQVQASNLFFVTTQNCETTDCYCSYPTQPYMMDREELKYSREEICRKMREHKSGRKADGCDSHHREKTKRDNLTSRECSSSFSIHDTTRLIHRTTVFRLFSLGSWPLRVTARALFSIITTLVVMESESVIGLLEM